MTSPLTTHDGTAHTVGLTGWKPNVVTERGSLEAATRANRAGLPWVGELSHPLGRLGVSVDRCGHIVAAALVVDAEHYDAEAEPHSCWTSYRGASLFPVAGAAVYAAYLDRLREDAL